MGPGGRGDRARRLEQQAERAKEDAEGSDERRDDVGEQAAGRGDPEPDMDGRRGLLVGADVDAGLTPTRHWPRGPRARRPSTGMNIGQGST